MIYEDLDDLYNGLEMQVMNFNDYREVTTSGFKELIQLHDSTKSDLENQFISEIEKLKLKLTQDIKDVSVSVGKLEVDFNSKLKEKRDGSKDTIGSGIGDGTGI